MKKSTRIALGVTTFCAGAAVSFVSVGEMFYRMLLTSKAVHGSKLLEEDKEFEEIFNTNELMLDGKDWLENEAQTIKVTARSPRDGETLHAVKIYSDTPSDVWVLCAHGYAVTAESNAAQAKRFHGEGYNVLMPHLCGHGESECKFVSMGWLDRLDICAWIDEICAENPQAKIVLYGISMGGAAVMMTVGEELPPNVVCAIEDCGYTSVLDEFNTQIKQALHLPTFPFIPAADFATRIHTGCSFGDASSVKQLKKAKIPMLFIHGEDDDFVPSWMLEACYEAAACEEKEKLLVPGAGHALSGLVNPELYFSTVNGFIKKHINLSPQRG